MATRPELHIAVAKTKSKASEYNDNFEMMMDFVDSSIGEAKDYVDGFMPDVTGNAGKFLKTDGTTTSWFDIFGSNNTFTGDNTFSGNITMSGDSGKTFDGQMIYSGQSILSSASLTGSTPLTKTVTLPNDGHTYLVYFSGRCYSTTTTFDTIVLSLSGNVLNGQAYCTSAYNPYNTTVPGWGFCIVPLKYGSNNLSIARNSSYKGTATLTAVWYRRVGTNT